jgi:hypothetical protein
VLKSLFDACNGDLKIAKMDLQTKVLEPGVAILCILESRDDRKTGGHIT